MAVEPAHDRALDDPQSLAQGRIGIRVVHVRAIVQRRRVSMA